MKKGLNQTHYEILEVSPGASEEEIRRAYERIRNIYGPNSITAYGLYSQENLNEFLDKVAQAFHVLMDNEARKEYDAGLFSQKPTKYDSAEGIVIENIDLESWNTPNQLRAESAGAEPPSSSHDSDQTPAPLPKVQSGRKVGLPPLDVDESLVFSGEVLRELREKAGVSIRDMAQETKISPGNLRYIENEDFKMLPAKVYVKGFVKEYARYLGLDGKRVAADIIDRIDKQGVTFDE